MSTNPVPTDEGFYWFTPEDGKDTILWVGPGVSTAIEALPGTWPVDLVRNSDLVVVTERLEIATWA